MGQRNIMLVEGGDEAKQYMPRHDVATQPMEYEQEIEEFR